uniref:Uncharacterized protein n=1 Tax=Arundo donax TaxID=35708 RepID=A0A0A9FBI2_ARUDO
MPPGQNYKCKVKFSNRTIDSKKLLSCANVRLICLQSMGISRG